VWLLTFVAPAADALLAARVLPALLEVVKLVSRRVEIDGGLEKCSPFRTPLGSLKLLRRNIKTTR
jgi:hypothetical protein